MKDLEMKTNTTDGITEISLWGRIDSSNAECFQESVLAEISDKTDLILDFRGLEYLSSAGLRALLTIQKTLKGADHLTIRGSNEYITQIFEVTGFYDLLHIV